MMNRHRASGSKALINLSNTACGRGSDEKLRQLPGAPGTARGHRGGGSMETHWDSNGNLRHSTAKSMTINGLPLRIHRFSLSTMGIQLISNAIPLISVEHLMEIHGVAMKVHRFSLKVSENQLVCNENQLISIENVRDSMNSQWNSIGFH